MKIFTQSEEITKRLARLYRSFGYDRFKMSKFEEYSFYIEHKSFLQSENVITFGDLDGKLMALKPDITLSIAKNAREGETRRVYYNENVYRPSQSAREYREIPQIGLEFIGNVDALAECETVLLALRTMETLGGRYTLDLSDARFVPSVLEHEGFSEGDREKILDAVKKKDRGRILDICAAAGKDEKTAERVAATADVHGRFDKAIAKAEKISKSDGAREALDGLKKIYAFLGEMGATENVNLDFSIINDMNYYNGVVFQGYLEDVPKNVLSGGRYDNLLGKMGKTGGACGFAVYLDLIELYRESGDDDMADIAVIYGEGDDVSKVEKFADGLRADGQAVVCAAGKDSVRAKKTVYFGEAKK